MRTFPQKRADALAQMAEHYVATADQGGDAVPLKGSEQCQVMLHVDVETLQEKSDSKNCRLGEGTWVAPSVAERLSIENHGKDVSAETCITRWNGERMDPYLTVELLFQAKESAEKAQLQRTHD